MGRKIKHDPAIYSELKKFLDGFFKKHGAAALWAVNRYMRLRRQTKKRQKEIRQLEKELAELKKQG